MPEQEIIFCEAVLDGVGWQAGFDVCEIGAGGAGVDVYSFFEQFFSSGMLGARDRRR